MMRFIILSLLCLSLLGCAAPQIIQKPYPQSRVLTTDDYRTLSDVAALNRHVLRLRKGDTFPLKLSVDSQVIELGQPQVDVVVKQDVFFRVDLPDAMAQERLDRLTGMTPENLSRMTPAEKQALFKGIGMFISLDGNRWASLKDRRAIKQVLGIKQGEISLGMSLSQTEGLWSAVTMRFIPRESE